MREHPIGKLGMQNIVLDTNCLIMAVSANGAYNKVWQDFLDGRYNLCISNDILEEYVEAMGRNIRQEFAEMICYVILNSENTILVDPTFSFNMITSDIDDNKFVDCAVVANAKYIVSNDKHFNVLKDIPFPHIDVINIDDFLHELNNVYNKQYF